MSKYAHDEFRSINPKNTVRILRDSADEDPFTIPQLLNKTVDRFGERNALMCKDKSSKEWKGIDYREFKIRVEKVAKAFIKLGLERHGAVAILASNCFEWFISELAAIYAG